MLYLQIMKYFVRLIISLPVLLLLPACSPREEDPTPSVLSVSPASCAKEAGVAHTLVFRVSCDKAFKASLDASWASIESQTEGAGDVTTLTVSITANEGEGPRTCKLLLESGKKSAEASITQLPAKDLLDISLIELFDILPFKVTLKLPESWTLTCLDEDGRAADWYSASITSGGKNEIKVIQFTAFSLNTGSEVRTGKVEINIGGVKIYIPVSQPVTETIGADLGVFNYDHAGAEIKYDALRHQVSLLRGAGSDSFRITEPERAVFILLEGLPKKYTDGEKLSFDFVQNWVPSLGFSRTVNAEVVRQDDQFVWLLDGDVWYVVKK